MLVCTVTGGRDHGPSWFDCSCYAECGMNPSPVSVPRRDGPTRLIDLFPTRPGLVCAWARVHGSGILSTPRPLFFFFFFVTSPVCSPSCRAPGSKFEIRPVYETRDSLNPDVRVNHLGLLRFLLAIVASRRTELFSQPGEKIDEEGQTVSSLVHVASRPRVGRVPLSTKTRCV